MPWRFIVRQSNKFEGARFLLRELSKWFCAHCCFLLWLFEGPTTLCNQMRCIYIFRIKLFIPFQLLWNLLTGCLLPLANRSFILVWRLFVYDLRFWEFATSSGTFATKLKLLLLHTGKVDFPVPFTQKSERCASICPSICGYWNHNKNRR